MDKPEPVAFRWRNTNGPWILAFRREDIPTQIAKVIESLYGPDCMEALIMERDRADKWKALAQQINTDWIPANKALAERAEKSEAEAAALREELRKQAAEAYTDVEAWGAYASEYFQAKWNLDGDLKKWTERSAIKEAK